MSNYYDMREGKVRIAEELMKRGWKVYGYHADASDSMTDYYDPACWLHGIATKNGFILVVDNRYDHKEEELKQYNPNGFLSAADREKISKLEQMTVERGCTADEEKTAKGLIQDIQSKTEGKEKHIVIGVIPAYMANPGKCKWHIEKDGKIYDKGTGITKYADIPRYGFDITTEKYLPGFDTWMGGEKKTLSEKEQKAVTDLKALILRFERVVNGLNTCGDGTAETAAEAAEQSKNDSQEMEKIVETVTKKVIRPVLKQDSEINKDDVLSFSYHGHYWIVADIWENNKGVPCATYELLGSEKRGYQRLHGTSAKRYYQPIPRLLKEIEEGKTKIYTLQEVEETTEVEKWVRKSQTKQTRTKRTKTETDEATETAAEQPENELEYDIKQDTDTRDNSIIYVVKIVKTLSRDEYITANQYMRSIGGYYSKFKKGFIFKTDPTKILTGKDENKTTEPNNDNAVNKEQEKQKQAEVKQIKKQHLADKIDKQIESAQSKINSLSGDYKTNTYKRMNEQATRDSKIEGFQLDIEILEWLKMQLSDRDLTLFEENLITGAFRDTIHYYFRQHEYYNKTVAEKRNSTSQEIKYPDYIQPSDSWYNKEVPKKQKQLNKAGINNTRELIKAVEYYGEIYKQASKPVDRKAQQIKKLESEYKLRQKGDINFTPSEIAEQLARLARIDENSRVLEPSAGIGNIADVIRQTTKNIDVVECMSDFRELLKLKGYNLVGDDFLEYETDQLYDAIIANVPFSDEQNHIKHAYSLLKDGGTLVSITSPHWTFANDKKSKEFREWTENESSYTLDLRSGTFEMTGVAAKILVIEKSEQTEQKTA